MGQDLKGRELGVGIAQRKDGRYTARFVDKRGKRKQKYFKKLQECRRWLAEAAYIDRNSDLSAGDSMTVGPRQRLRDRPVSDPRCKRSHSAPSGSGLHSPL